MPQEMGEAVRNVLFSPTRCTDPILALEEASEELGLELSVRTLDDLSEEEAGQLLQLLEDLYPDRTDRIIRRAVLWARSS